jgi:hypothetical protein
MIKILLLQIHYHHGIKTTVLNLDIFRRICCFICPCALGAPPPCSPALIGRSQKQGVSFDVYLRFYYHDSFNYLSHVLKKNGFKEHCSHHIQPLHYHDSDNVACLVHTNTSVTA